MSLRYCLQVSAVLTDMILSSNVAFIPGKQNKKIVKILFEAFFSYSRFISMLVVNWKHFRLKVMNLRNLCMPSVFNATYFIGLFI
jgi:hypothetical protein